MAKLHFQQLLIQSSVSHDPLEMILIFWFSAQEMLLMVDNRNSFVMCNMVSEFFDKERVQIITLIWNDDFVTLWMSLLSPLINLMHPCINSF